MAARLLRRLGLVALGALVALIAAEVLLRTGAWYLAAAGRGRPVDRPTGSRVVLCVGDSNTYGFFVKPEQAYPQQLQRTANVRQNVAPIEVLNLGVPGNNSSRLRAGFAEFLQVYDPDVALIMIGANDGWTTPAPIHGQSPTFEQRLWQASRVYRLVSMVRLAATGIAHTGEDSSGEVSPERHPVPASLRYSRDEQFDLTQLGRTDLIDNWQGPYETNVDAIVAMARLHGTRPILLTYPSSKDIYAFVNPVIRRIAARNDVELVDVAKALAASCEREICSDLFFPDFHPTPRGYEMVARSVLDSVGE